MPFGPPRGNDNLPGFVPVPANVVVHSIETMALLQTADSRAGDVVYLRGFRTERDGGEGFFRWDATVEEVDDDGGTVIFGHGGGWRRIFSGPLYVTWFGMIGEYQTDWSTIPDANSDAYEACRAVAVATGCGIHFPKLPGLVRTVYQHSRTCEHPSMDPAWIITEGSVDTCRPLEVSADPGVETFHTGEQGNCWAIDGGPTGTMLGTGLIMNARMKNLIIRGAHVGNLSQAASAIDATANTYTIADHGFSTGDPVTLTNTGGAIPTSLAALTTYFLIVDDEDTLRFAATEDDAYDGTAIDWSGGSGTQRVVSSGSAVGLYVRASHQCIIEDVDVRDVTKTAFHVEGCTSIRFVNPRCSTNWQLFERIPLTGMRFTKRVSDTPPAGGSTMNVVVNGMMEGLSEGVGLRLEDFATQTLFLGGTTEGNATGILTETDAANHRFVAMQLDSNTLDIDGAGSFNTFEDLICTSGDNVTWRSGARGNVLRGGTYYGNTTTESTYAQAYDRVAIIDGGSIVDTVSSGDDRATWLVDIGGSIDRWTRSAPPEYADNAAALGGGLIAGDRYHTAGVLKVVT